ncbi:MAG: hypothetical protein ACTTKL_07805 [Treponema sp.]
MRNKAAAGMDKGMVKYEWKKPQSQARKMRADKRRCKEDTSTVKKL